MNWEFTLLVLGFIFILVSVVVLMWFYGECKLMEAEDSEVRLERENERLRELLGMGDED